MPLQPRQIELIWRDPEEPSAMPALQAAIDKWIGTPYAEGQKAPGRGGGVDCVRFVEAVLEELYNGKAPGEYESIRKVPQDAAVHDLRTVSEVAQEMMRRYPHELRCGDIVEVHPGDVITCRVGRRGGEGHAAIVGPRPWSAYHAMAPSVCMTGVGAIYDVWQVIHLKEKHRWSRRSY